MPPVINRRDFVRHSSASLALASAVAMPAYATAQASSDAANADEIWDLHGHLAGGTGATPQARMQRLMQVADRMGVAKVCVYMA